jgi:hypothetical protein
MTWVVQSLRLAISKELKRVGDSSPPHLKMEKHPVPEMFCFLVD